MKSGIAESTKTKLYIYLYNCMLHFFDDFGVYPKILHCWQTLELTKAAVFSDRYLVTLVS